MPCDPELSRLAGRCLDNTYDEMHHGACPKSSRMVATGAKTETYPDQRRSEGSSSKKETDDLTKVLSTQGKRTIGNIKKLVRSVTKKTLSRKNSKAELVKCQSGNTSERGECASAPISSEQLAEEYQSLLGEHPSLQDTDSEYCPSPVIRSPDIETSTTWSGLMGRAMGQVREERWSRGLGGERIKYLLPRPQEERLQKRPQEMVEV